MCRDSLITLKGRKIPKRLHGANRFFENAAKLLIDRYIKKQLIRYIARQWSLKFGEMQRKWGYEVGRADQEDDCSYVDASKSETSDPRVVGPICSDYSVSFIQINNVTGTNCSPSSISI
jgi:hypothetical protein